MCKKTSMGLATTKVRIACVFKLRSSVVTPPLLRKSLSAVWKSYKNEIWLLKAQKSWFSQLAPFSCLYMLKSFIFGGGWIRWPGFACLKLRHKCYILPSTCPRIPWGSLTLLLTILFPWGWQVINLWLRFGMAVVRVSSLPLWLLLHCCWHTWVPPSIPGA